jgi:hypothetical protein
MMRGRRISLLGLSAILLSGCTLVSTSSSPNVINNDDVPLGLLNKTIPFTDDAQVRWVTRDIYMVDAAQQVIPVGRLVTSPPTYAEVAQHIPSGPTPSEKFHGVSTDVPASLIVNQAGIYNGVAKVDVTDQLSELPVSARRIAVAQFLFTAVALGATKGIEMSINTTPYALKLPSGASVLLVTPADLAYLKKD